MLTFCVYLDETGLEQGPLTAVPGTHRGPLFEQFDDDGRWTGALADRDIATLPTDTIAELGGPAGTVVLLHCRVVHGSAANYSSRMRPLLLNVYAAADALPMTPAPTAEHIMSVPKVSAARSALPPAHSWCARASSSD